MVLGGSCPGGYCPQGSYPMGVIVLQSSCPWGSCPQGSCPRGCPVTVVVVSEETAWQPWLRVHHPTSQQSKSICICSNFTMNLKSSVSYIQLPYLNSWMQFPLMTVMDLSVKLINLSHLSFPRLLGLLSTASETFSEQSESTINLFFSEKSKFNTALLSSWDWCFPD